MRLPASSRLVPHTRLVLALVLLGVPIAAADAAARATTIFVVRHAEKAAADGDVPLSSAGRERAALLARTLRDAGVTRIFTSQMTRTRETAAPLAEALKVEPQTLPAQDTPALVAAVRALPAGSTVLIVGHSNTVPAIVEQLGGPRVADVADDEFDRLLVLTITDGRATLATLRYGERPKGQP